MYHDYYVDFQWGPVQLLESQSERMPSCKYLIANAFFYVPNWSLVASCSETGANFADLALACEDERKHLETCKQIVKAW